MPLKVDKQYGRGGWINFTLESDLPITREDAQQNQLGASYHPNGYGFYDFKVTTKDGKYIATWRCANSCD